MLFNEMLFLLEQQRYNKLHTLFWTSSFTTNIHNNNKNLNENKIFF